LCQFKHGRRGKYCSQRSETMNDSQRMVTRLFFSCSSYQLFGVWGGPGIGIHWIMNAICLARDVKYVKIHFVKSCCGYARVSRDQWSSYWLSLRCILICPRSTLLQHRVRSIVTYSVHTNTSNIYSSLYWELTEIK